MFLWKRAQTRRTGPAEGDWIAALDVGTTKVVCFIARVDSAQSVGIVGIGHHRARGVRAGAIVDMEAAEDSVRAAVHAAERMAGDVVHDAYVNLSGGSQESHTVGVDVAVTGNQVSESDIHRAIDQAMVRAGVQGREVVHAIPLHYSIDGATGIRDPRGMFGANLGANLHIVTAEAGQARNVAICTGRGHLEVRGLVSSGYASGLAVLVDDEAELGATVIDMGGGMTTISVFAEGGPVLVDSVPLGGQHVTNDIARGLGTTVAHAERMKTLYGSAVGTEADEREMIDVPLVGEAEQTAAHHVPRAELTRIVAPRIEELFELAAARLSAAGADPVAGRRVVLTGGASQLDGVNEVAARVLDKQVRLGRPIHVHGLAESAAGPAFATCAGMLSYAASGLAAADVGALAATDRGGSTLAMMGRWLRQNL